MHTTTTTTSRPTIRTKIRAGVIFGALLSGTLAAAPSAAAAADIEGSATVQFQGRLTAVVDDGDGSCEYEATVRVRGRTDEGRKVRANRLPMTASAPCDAALQAGIDITGQGEVDFVGRAGGRTGPIRIERATGVGTFMTDGATGLWSDIGLGVVLEGFLLEGDLLGRVDASTPKGQGVCAYSLTAQIDGVTSDGFRLRPTRYTEVEWTLMCNPELTAGTRVEGTISGDATGTRSGKWIDVLSLDVEATLVADGVEYTGFGSWATSAGT